MDRGPIMAGKFWLLLTVVISAVFAILAFPVFQQANGPLPAALYTLLGLGVIWIVFSIRSWIFSKPGFRDGVEEKR